MAILPIYTYDATVLRARTLEVQRPDDEIQRLITDMLQTMKAANGVGLAANQVGRKHSLFVIDLSDVEDYEGTPPLIAINPIITEFWGDDVTMEEGCLSVPGLRDDIVRPERVHIRYRDEQFQEKEFEADGFLARVIQHEYDHLQGVFFTDYLRGLRKTLVAQALNKIKKGDTDADYPLASLKEMYS
jgi:peptide deformylase